MLLLSLLFLPGAKRLHPQDVLTRSKETRRNLLVSGPAESGCESVTALRFADGIFNIFFHHYSKTAQRYEKKMIYTNIYHFFKANVQKIHEMRQFVAIRIISDTCRRSEWQEKQANRAYASG